MIQNPYNLSVKDKIIDGNLPYSLSWLTSGDVSNSFSISVYNNLTDALVYQLARTYSYAMSYTIPANSIPNGAEYKISVTVWNASDQSATSQLVVFQAYSTPTVTVPEIGVVGNHSYLFTATYNQAESDPISTYTCNLYNANQTLLKSSGVKTDGLMEHRFDLMKNDLTYYVEFVVTSKKGLTATSGLIPFTVVYENPSMYFTLEAETLPETASVKLKWGVKQVVGKTTVAPVYINGEELDVRTGKVFYDEGFEIVRNFTLKIWLSEIEYNADLVYLKGDNGSISLRYETDDKFHLYKKIGVFTSHYIYPLLIDEGGVFISPYQYLETTNGKAFLCMQQKYGEIDIYGEKISEV